jgi:nucleotide-binding universal stress UspA family protein
MMDVSASVPERVLRASPATAVASVMVYVDFDDHSDHRIRIAAELASRFGAVLIGVAGALPGREAGGWFAGELEPDQPRLDRILGELDRLGERFRAVAHRTVGNMEWRGSFHFPREVLVAEARAADLVVIGSHPVEEDIYHAFDPGMVLLGAGRPVLVVPDGLGEVAPGERVLVAWKDTREARHAVQSALPYLKTAKHITLVEIAEDIAEPSAKQHLDDVERYLLRHGVAVDIKSVLHPRGAVADQLLDEAKKHSADLIVAGAYGHTRLGEWVFGGATRGLLLNSTVCCLFCN